MKKLLAAGLIQILVFGLLGSSIWTAAGLALFAFLFWHSDLSLETAIGLAGLFLAVLPYTLVYACGIAMFDFVVGLVKVSYRALLCALVGLGSLDWMMFAFAPDTSRLFGSNLVAMSLLGALPAAFCSWLCQEIAEGRWAICIKLSRPQMIPEVRP